MTYMPQLSRRSFVFSVAALGGGLALGFHLPTGMSSRHLLVAGIIAGIGFTVALFVAGEAFTDPTVQGAAKMGAMLSIAVFPLAAAAARLLGIRRKTP